MIKVRKLTEKDLDFLKQKRVVIYHLDGEGYDCYNILVKLGINVVAYYSESMSQKQRVKWRIKGVPTITQKKLEKLFENKEDIVIQTVAFDADNVNRAITKTQEWSVEISPYTSGQIATSFANLTVCELKNNLIFRMWKYFQWEKVSACKKPQKINRFNGKILLCLPPKTGDYTLFYTFDTINQSVTKTSARQEDAFAINYLAMGHQIPKLEKNTFRDSEIELKFITAVRDPIAQNISRMYQDISEGIPVDDWLFGNLRKSSLMERKTTWNTCVDVLSENENWINAANLWLWFVERFVYHPNKRVKISRFPRSIQKFVSEFSSEIVDILAYPFDKEKGYAIIKEGNIEVFIYQLEKLNNLVPELSEWVGVPFDKLKKGNVGEDKWIGESYKHAQKEIEITQEYFDRCFDEPYVKHCYAEADIEKFKAKWKGHIK